MMDQPDRMVDKKRKLNGGKTAQTHILHACVSYESALSYSLGEWVKFGFEAIQTSVPYRNRLPRYMPFIEWILSSKKWNQFDESKAKRHEYREIRSESEIENMKQSKMI